MKTIDNKLEEVLYRIQSVSAILQALNLLAGLEDNHDTNPHILFCTAHEMLGEVTATLNEVIKEADTIKVKLHEEPCTNVNQKQAV